MTTAMPTRCPWAKGKRYERYHDAEWGVPSRDDRHLFEMLILEAAQAGLSWSTILNKRENYRKAYARFDPRKVARFDEAQQQKLLANPGIVRNRLKISASIDSALAFVKIQQEFGSFATYLWAFVEGTPIVNHPRKLGDVPPRTPLSDMISKDFQGRGFRFVGSTIIYAYLQAVGVVNDHLVSCPRHGACASMMRDNRVRPDSFGQGSNRASHQIG